MSIANVVNFYEKVANDEVLQGKLERIAGEYEGQSLSDGLKKTIMEEKMVPLAKEEGFDVTGDEMIEYLDECARKLDAQEALSVARGKQDYIGSNTSFSRGELVAAKVAKHSIMNAATNAANEFFNDTYKDD